MQEVQRPLLQLRAQRLRRGLTQTALAYRAGLAPQAISALETGYIRPQPTAKMLKRLARALGIPAEELLQPVPPQE